MPSNNSQAVLAKSTDSQGIYRRGYAVLERRGRLTDFATAWPITRFQARKAKARLERRGHTSLSLYYFESFVPPEARPGHRRSSAGNEQ